MSTTHIAFVRDHSGSMSTIRSAAVKDFNTMMDSVRRGALTQPTRVSILECGYGSTSSARIISRGIDPEHFRPITEYGYTTNGGGTPLWDSVGMAIDLLERYDEGAYESEDTEELNEDAFLVFVTTDGHENASILWNITKLSKKIKELQNRGNWTFVFRVPFGNKHTLVERGIPADNIIEWEKTTKGQQEAARRTEQAFDSYYTTRGLGFRSTSSFYADLSNVTTNEVKQKLDEVTHEILEINVPHSQDGAEIRPFIEKRTRRALTKGQAFYQLTKTEKEVQDYKIIVIKDRKTGRYYAGHAARQMLGLPTYGTVKLVPDDLGKFEVFIQSTSVNRKLVGGTTVLFWETPRS